MEIKLHKNATTTLSIREAIKKSSLSINAIAKKYNLSWNTVKKWKERDDIQDKSSKPDKLNITLTKQEEDLILFLRKHKKLSPDEIYCALQDKISNLYPMKVYRWLRRHNLNKLPDEFIKEERRIKKFKKYTIGYLHIDTLYTPKINKTRHYIFTCIDRVSKLAYVMVVKNKTRHLAKYSYRKY